VRRDNEDKICIETQKLRAISTESYARVCLRDVHTLQMSNVVGNALRFFKTLLTKNFGKAEIEIFSMDYFPKKKFLGNEKNKFLENIN
jgi:hypothetical protein